MKNVSDTIGIDVSKLTLDVHQYHSSKSKCFDNNVTGFKKLLAWITKNDPHDFFVCFENTGYYSLSLAVFLQEKDIPFAMLSPIQIKRSLGLVRGKSDQIDAYQIAKYAWQHREEIQCSRVPDKLILELSQVLKLREQLVKQRVSLYNMLEAFGQNTSMVNKSVVRMIKQQIKRLTQLIQQTEQELRELLTHHSLKEHDRLLQSVIGVGPILAAQLIAHTHNFMAFANWRQFACYAGIAPFEHTSGTSIKGKTRVHHIADRKLKQLLNMAALSAINHDPQIKGYYQRKVQEGKHKMAVINAVRCKILARCFAVVKRKTPFVELQSFAA